MDRKAERIAQFEKEYQYWTIEAYKHLNKCDHANYSQCMVLAEKYKSLLDKAKAL